MNKLTNEKRDLIVQIRYIVFKGLSELKKVMKFSIYYHLCNLG